jgi:hypothetical protein
VAGLLDALPEFVRLFEEVGVEVVGATVVCAEVAPEEVDAPADVDAPDEVDLALAFGPSAGSEPSAIWTARAPPMTSATAVESTASLAVKLGVEGRRRRALDRGRARRGVALNSSLMGAMIGPLPQPAVRAG